MLRRHIGTKNLLNAAGIRWPDGQIYEGPFDIRHIDRSARRTDNRGYPEASCALSVEDCDARILKVVIELRLALLVLERPVDTVLRKVTRGLRFGALLDIYVDLLSRFVFRPFKNAAERCDR